MSHNAFFFVPFLYRFYTRKSGKFAILPFLLTDFLPPLVFLSNSVDLDVAFVCSYFLAYLSMFICYEFGYIVNDTITILHEKSPTIRLSDAERAYFYRNGVLVAGIRLFTLLALCLLLRFVFSISVESLLFGCFFVLAIYCLNNHYRNAVRFVANFFLNVAKYAVPLLPFATSKASIPYVVLLLAFPFGRFLFFCLKHCASCGDFLLDGIQCAFYLCVAILTALLYKSNELNGLTVSFCVLFLLYRVATFFLKSKSHALKAGGK